jgi:surfactin synthase thioesterase subunit
MRVLNHVSMSPSDLAILKELVRKRKLSLSLPSDLPKADKPFTNTNGPRRTEKTPWLTCVKPKPTAPYRLIVFTWTGNRGGGGCVADLRSKIWHDRLPDFEVYEVTLPAHGLRMGEKPMKETSTLVERMAADLHAALQGGKPYCMLGFAFGAVLAWEVAIVISGLMTPWGVAGEGPALLCAISAEGPHWRGRGLALPAEAPRLHELDDDAFEAMLRRRGGTDPGLLDDAGIKDLFLDIIRSDIQLEETYQVTTPHERIGGMPIMAIYGVEAGNDDEKTHLPAEHAQLWCTATTNAFKKVVPLEGVGWHVLEEDAGVAKVLHEITSWMRVKLPH